MNKPTNRAPARPRSSFPPIARCPRPPDWPEADRRAWESAQAKAGPFNPGGAAAHWAKQTRTIREQAWGRFLSYLEASEQLKPVLCPTDRLTFDAVSGFIVSMRERLSANTVHQTIIELAQIAFALEPQKNWLWIRAHPHKPTAREAKMSMKPVASFDARALFAAAVEYCDAADVPTPELVHSVQYLDGLLVLFTLCTALRHKNLWELELGQHLLINHGQVRLAFDSSVKNNTVIDVNIEGKLRDCVLRYLERHRPVLLRGHVDPRAFWISHRGSRLSYGVMYNRFRATTKSLIGQELNMHVVRHALATELQSLDPCNLPLASAALGHKGKATVLRSYAHAGSSPANRAWQNHLRALKHR